MTSFQLVRRAGTTAGGAALVSRTTTFARRRSRRRIPRLAEGSELIGRFKDSGLKEAPYLVRRSDGQIVQLPWLLYVVAEELDGRRDYREVAARASRRIQRGVSPQVAEMLVKEKLVPLGLVVPGDGSQSKLKKVDPLTALKFRVNVVPERWVTAATSLFRPLFLHRVLGPMLVAFVALDVWLFGIHGISQSVRRTLYDPALLLLLLVGVVAATAFHEIGHATGCRYGGARPGVMGIGIYIVWPAFYTDITDAYRLNKSGRLRADLGGIYFNAVFALCVAAIYLVTHFEALLLLIVLQNFAILQQSLPLLRLDGYYIVSDLTGVPDILMRIRPVLSSLIPGRPADPRVVELKPRVRRVVTSYIATVIPLVALVFVMMLIHAPRAFATAAESVRAHYHHLALDVEMGKAAPAAVAGLQMTILVLPALGLVYTTTRVTGRLVAAVRRWSAGSRQRQLIAAIGSSAAISLLALAWWPGPGYRPIQRSDRGTIVQALAHLVWPRAQMSSSPAVPKDGSSSPGSAAVPQSGRGGRSASSPASQSNRSAGGAGPAASATSATTGASSSPPSATPSGGQAAVTTSTTTSPATGPGAGPPTRATTTTTSPTTTTSSSPSAATATNPASTASTTTSPTTPTAPTTTTSPTSTGTTTSADSGTTPQTVSP